MLTADEIERVRSLFRKGNNLKQAAEEMKVSRNALTWRLLKSGYGVRLELYPLNPVASSPSENPTATASP